MSNIIKCVILARGLGKRMRQVDDSTNLDAAQAAIANAGVKAMVPIGRPFLDYVLSALADAEFTEICLVIGPEHEFIREYYTSTADLQRIRICFAVQAKPLGTANAVLAAEEFCGRDNFLVINGDNYYPCEVLQQIQGLGAPGTVLFEAESLIQHSNMAEDRVCAFATCIVDSDGFLADIVEKPEFVASKFVSMNCWRFGPAIFQACRDVPTSPRNEFELPLAVKLAIQRGTRLKTAISRSGVLDLSQRSDIATVGARLQGVRVVI
jgi:glucose-1-phosphate thymidylyltransferase